MASNQFDLFGDRPTSEVTPPEPRLVVRKQAELRIEPTAFAESLAILASRLPSGARFGTSSWSFPGWSGLVYAGEHSERDLARSGLPAYVAHPLLRTVGIDRTFYGPISEAAYRGYAKQARVVSADFRFLVKAPLLFTGPSLRDDEGRWLSNEAFLNASLATTQFVAPATAGLAELCGPLVFQFPPLGPRFTRSPTRFADALAEFLLALPKLSGGPFYAIEVRDPELLTDDYLAALCAGEATHCLAIHARMPEAQAQARFWRESGRRPLVIRWSLHSGLKYEEAKARYAPFNALVDEDPEGRAQVAALALEAAGAHQDCYVVVNNKAEGSAPLTIRKLSELIAGYGETIVRRS